MKFAFLILGPFGPDDRAEIHGGSAAIIGVRTVDRACEEAKALAQNGVTCIELCGAFGPEGCRRVAEAVPQTPVGYVTHLPEHDRLFIRTFGK